VNEIIANTPPTRTPKDEFTLLSKELITSLQELLIRRDIMKIDINKYIYIKSLNYVEKFTLVG